MNKNENDNNEMNLESENQEATSEATSETVSSTPSLKDAKKQNKKPIDKNNIRENEIVSRDEKIDKRVYLGVGIAALVAILIVIFVCIIQWDSDKENIRKQYPSLPQSHVLETINMDSVKEKIANGETFQLLIASPSISSANDFATYVDEYAKKDEYQTDTIYYIRAEALTTADKTLFRRESHSFPVDITQPIILFFTPTNEVTSTIAVSSNDRNVGDFNNNYYTLLSDYFNDVRQTLD